MQMRDKSIYTTLRVAISKNDSAQVKFILENNQIDINYLGEEGLNEGIDSNGTTVTGNSSYLGHAAEIGNIDICRMLIEYGAKLDHVNDKNETAMMLAARHKNIDLHVVLAGHEREVIQGVNYLINELIGALEKTYAQHIEIKDIIEKLKSGKRECISDMLSLLLSIDKQADSIDQAPCLFIKSQINLIRKNVDSCLSDGVTPLHLAAGSFNHVKALLAMGFNANAKNFGGNTPLHVAAKFAGNIEVIKLMCEYGGNAIIKNRQGQKPVDVAIYSSDDVVINYFKQSQGQQLLGIDITPSLQEEWVENFQLPLTTSQMDLLQSLATRIKQGELPQVIEEYKQNIDHLAYLSYMACAYQFITTVQLATILEVRSILQLAPLQMVIEPINTQSLGQDDSLINRFIDIRYSPDFDPYIKEDFVKLNESNGTYCLNFTVKPGELLKNPLFTGFLDIGVFSQAFTIKKDAENNTIEITWLSVGARLALSAAVYKENVKYPDFYQGTEIDRNRIATSAIQRARCIGTSFPGRIDPVDFHGLVTPMIYMIMHDEFHRLFISTIPNQVYDGIIRLARQFRTMTGRAWSREIWHLIDMDFDIYRLKFGFDQTGLSESELTQQFIELLYGYDLDGNPIGLLMPNPYCDTTWMFLIDLVKYKEAWSILGINGDYLPEPFKAMYNCVCGYDCTSADTSLSLAKLLLKIKCTYLNIDVPTDAEIAFSKREKGKSTFIEVLVNGEAFPVSKDILLSVEKTLLKEFHHDPVRFEFTTFAMRQLPDERQRLLVKIPALKEIIIAMGISPVNQEMLQELIPFIERYKDNSSVLTKHADALTGILQLLKTNQEGIMRMLQVVNSIPVVSRTVFLADTTELIKTLNAYQQQPKSTPSTVLFNTADAGNRQDIAVVSELLKYLGGTESNFTKDQIESLVDKSLQVIILQYMEKYLHLWPNLHQAGIGSVNNLG